MEKNELQMLQEIFERVLGHPVEKKDVLALCAALKILFKHGVDGFGKKLEVRDIIRDGSKTIDIPAHYFVTFSFNHMMKLIESEVARCFSDFDRHPGSEVQSSPRYGQNSPRYGQNSPRHSQTSLLTSQKDQDLDYLATRSSPYSKKQREMAINWTEHFKWMQDNIKATQINPWKIKLKPEEPEDS